MFSSDLQCLPILFASMKREVTTTATNEWMCRFTEKVIQRHSWRMLAAMISLVILTLMTQNHPSLSAWCMNGNISLRVS